MLRMLKKRLFRRNLRRNERGMAFMEFALMSPVLLGMILGGLEFAHYMAAGQKIQKLAHMTADLVARSTLQPNEAQINDIFLALDVAARPFTVRDDGRVILTGIVGIVNTETGDVENKLVWQRCSGDAARFQSAYGEEDELTPEERPNVELPGGVVVPQGQMVVVSEVHLRYRPLLTFAWLEEMTGLERDRSHSSVLRTRSKAFTSITPVPDVTPSTC
jgi:hypothetical protein